MIIEKVTQDDIILWEVLRHPVLCGEFIENFDKVEFEEEFNYTPYQKEFLCDWSNFVSICCARSVGKTWALTGMIIWAMINKIFGDEYVLYTVPGKAQLEPVFTRLTKMLRSNTLLKNWIEAKTGINNSDFTIKLLNMCTLMCRIAGQTGTGVNVIGLHTPFEIVDEAGYYPWGTWLELQPTLNKWTSGFRQITSGVPTGMREKNVLFHTDQENSNFTKHRISAYQNPRFSERDEEDAIKNYGNKDSDDFIHFVMGLHGKPIFALFDREMFEIGSYPVYKMTLNGIELKENIAEYFVKLALFPPLPDKEKGSFVFFGVDLGYTEPTAINIMYEDKHGQIKFHGRIRLEKVSYPIQQRLIDVLDTRFNPNVIGIDRGSGGSGVAVIQTLMEHPDFSKKDYKNRVIPVDFSSLTVLGIDADGEEIKSKTKPFAVSILQDYSNNHKIMYSSMDLELVTELERMTYTKTPTGEIVYRTMTARGGKRGEDHFTSALLCGIMAYYSTKESLNLRRNRKLMKPSWFASIGA